MRKAVGRFITAGASVALSLALGALSGCNAVQPNTVTDTAKVTFSLDGFSDATVDVTVSVVDATTLATLYTQSYSNQTTPFFASYSMAPAPVNAIMSVKFHLLPSVVLQTGTNGSPGSPSITDATQLFSNFLLPLFVVDNPAAPTQIWDVTGIITSGTVLTLGSSYPSGTYYLYQTRQLTGAIDYVHAATDTQVAAATDDTTSTVQFTASF